MPRTWCFPSPSLSNIANAADSSDDGEVDWAELFVYFGGDLSVEEEGHTFVCHDNGTEYEIPFEWVNDGWEDCPNGEDEPQDWMGGGENGTEPDGVTDNWFDCFDGTNISMDLVNDGFDDCSDGEDEYHEDEFGAGLSEEEFNWTWEYLLMFDADNSSTISFDEYSSRALSAIIHCIPCFSESREPWEYRFCARSTSISSACSICPIHRMQWASRAGPSRT